MPKVFSSILPIVGSAIGGPFGGAAGSALGGLMGGIGGGSKKSSGPPAPAPYKPAAIQGLTTPGSLSKFGGMPLDQQVSNIATQGVYGQGNGPEESKYFTNLVNNQLVDQSGSTKSLDTLSPIQNSYLSQLGFGGHTDTTKLLEQLSKFTG